VSAGVIAYLAAAVRRAAHLRRADAEGHEELTRRHRERVAAEREREREIEARLKERRP
jgi:hypothetical protein